MHSSLVPVSSQPSNSQSQDKPQIFVAADASPLPIFVESNGISDNRPRLIRTLRSHGANICVDVSLARIILVEPHSSEGRQFVRDWGMDPGKVILEVAWVRRCLEAGRALLENDAWGGCGNLDGTPLADDAIDDEEQGLFTESKAFGLNGRGTLQHTNVNTPPRTPSASNVSNGRSSVLPTPRPTPVEYGASSSEAYATGHDGPSTTSQRLPTPPVTSVSGQFPPSQSHLQHVQPSLPPSIAPPYGQLVPQSQFPMGPMNRQVMQAFLMNDPEATAMVFNMMVHGMTGNGQMIPPGWQGQPPQAFMQPPPGFQLMQPPHSQPAPSALPPNVSASATIHSLSTPVKVENQRPRESMSPLPTFTTVHESDSDSPPPNLSILSQRGKKRSQDSRPATSSNAAKRSRSQSPSSLNGKKRKKHSLLYDMAEQRDPIKRDRPPPIGIFTAKDGEPMAFFVQVQLRNRKDLTKAIRTNGGKLVSDLRDAEFIILDTRPGKDRDQWMKSVVDLKRFALRPGFIEACINSNGIVEEDDFIVEPLKRARKSLSAGRKRREDSVETEERNSPASGQLSQSRDVGRSDSNNPRSPSPPTGAAVMLPGGRYAFTSEEMTYALKLSEHLCRRDPNISNNQIATQLARRAPRHSQGSWLSKVNAQLRADIDRIREGMPNGGHIASSTGNPSGSEPEENQVEEQLTQAVEAEGAPTDDGVGAKQNGNDQRAPAHRSDEERSKLRDADLRTIVDFFANPPDGMVEDDALWAAITNVYTCHTALSWQDFYESNQEVVNQRLREALNMPPEGIAVTAT